MFGFGFWASGLSGLSGLGKKICFTQRGLYFHKKTFFCSAEHPFTTYIGTEVAVIHWNFWAPKNKFGNWFFPTLNHHLIGSSDLPIVGRERYFLISKSMQSLTPFSFFFFEFELELPHSSSSSGCKNEKKNKEAKYSILLLISHLYVLVSIWQEGCNSKCF